MPPHVNSIAVPEFRTGRHLRAQGAASRNPDQVSVDLRTTASAWHGSTPCVVRPVCHAWGLMARSKSGRWRRASCRLAACRSENQREASHPYRLDPRYVPGGEVVVDRRWLQLDTGRAGLRVRTGEQADAGPRVPTRTGPARRSRQCAGRPTCSSRTGTRARLRPGQSSATAAGAAPGSTTPPSRRVRWSAR